MHKILGFFLSVKNLATLVEVAAGSQNLIRQRMRIYEKMVKKQNKNTFETCTGRKMEEL
jgi:hypothetical protein